MKAEDLEIAEDIIKKLDETKQIYIIGLDIPLSITKGLFDLLERRRKLEGFKRRIPLEQFDDEDVLGVLLGVIP